MFVLILFELVNWEKKAWFVFSDQVKEKKRLGSCFLIVNADV